MKKQPFLPIILGSDENAYGTVRLFREFSDARPLLLCARLLTPTIHSKLFEVRIISDFDREEIFVPSYLLCCTSRALFTLFLISAEGSASSFELKDS